MRDPVLSLFRRAFGSEPESVVPVAADGSQRVYARLVGGPHGSVIGGIGPDRDENRAFLSFTRTFRELGLPVPELYAADEEAGAWLVEDLGETTLFQALERARAEAGMEVGGGEAGPRHVAGQPAFPDPILRVYGRVVEALPAFQIEGGKAIDFAVAYPRGAFDEQSIRWDLNYFKYHFLKLARVPFNEQKLEDDFGRLTAFLLRAEAGHFLYRDFQSRNVMVQGGAPRFIDYQGGRRGALQYDIASLLYDAKAELPVGVRERLLSRYLEALSERHSFDRARFLELYPVFALVRILQAMGSYGYRGYFERKTRFLESVPFAARNLRSLVEAGLPLALPELTGVLARIVDRWGGAGFGSGAWVASSASGASVVAGPLGTAEAPSGLAIRITSFSYRGGLPDGDPVHGGGFVFDCRSLPNPGREERFVRSTGRDADVRAFLEKAPEIEVFWSGVWNLVEPHARSFLARDFRAMSVAFGCTGGQHRSVYFAERLARILGERFPDARIAIEHREEPRWPPSTG